MQSADKRTISLSICNSNWCLQIVTEWTAQNALLSSTKEARINIIYDQLCVNLIKLSKYNKQEDIESERECSSRLFGEWKMTYV